MRGLVFAIVFAARAAQGGDAAAPAAEAYVANLEGVVTLTRAGAARALAEGDALAAGDRIATGEDASAEIVLADGSVVEAGERTRLVLRSLSHARGVLRFEANLEAGFLSNTVVPARGATYRVTTPTGTAGVRGTEFDLSFEEGEDGTDLAVEEGRVEVESVEGERQEIRAGRAGRFSRARFERRDEVRARLASRREAVRARIRTALERRFRAQMQEGRTPSAAEVYRNVPERIRERMSDRTKERLRESLRDRARQIRENRERRMENRRPAARRGARPAERRR